MENFNIKSIILGMGIGIVIASIINIIYLAGVNPLERLTKEDVVKAAKKYGMVESSGFVNEEVQRTPVPNIKTKNEVAKNTANASINPSTNQNTNTNINSNINGSLNKDTSVKDSNQANTTQQDQEIKIAIYTEDTVKSIAQKMLVGGLITDKQAFIDRFYSEGLSDEIITGEFKFKKGTETRQIMSVITGGM